MSKRYKILTAAGVALASLGLVTTGTWLVWSTTPIVITAEDPQDGDAQPIFQTVTLVEQDPIAINGIAQLSTDQNYYYNPELGDIQAINAKEGQWVKKGDVLFTYYQDKNQYDLEDAQRKLNRLYDQREELVQALSDQTGKSYNYQGDELEGYWGNDGHYYYYVSESIGKGGQATGDITPSQSADLADMAGMEGMEEADAMGGGLKDQIRQANEAIEDSEIMLDRLREQQHGEVKAKAEGRVVIDDDGRDDSQIPLVRVVSDDISVTGSVSEYDFFALQEDLPVELLINAENRTITGTMISHDEVPMSQAPTMNQGEGQGGSFNYAPSAAGQDSKYGFIVQPDDFIQPGFSLKVKITLPGVVIPNQALVEEGDQAKVFLYQEGRVKEVPLELTHQGTSKVSLKQLQPGDRLILNPYGLTDGQEVQVANDEGELDAGADEA